MTHGHEAMPYVCLFTASTPLTCVDDYVHDHMSAIALCEAVYTVFGCLATGYLVCFLASGCVGE